MADTLRLEVVTPTRRVLEARATEVRIPGVLGELGVLPGHTPLLASLGTGEVTWFDGETTGRLVVQGGFAEIQGALVSLDPKTGAVLALAGGMPFSGRADALGELELELTSINHGYRGFGERDGDGGRSGSCNNDVVCPLGDDWRSEMERTQWQS